MEKTGQITAKYGLKVTGVLSGAPNDYVKAQFALSGGGTVTWGGPSGYLKWTSRFIAISMERSSTFSSGYVNITLPTAASQITAYDGTNRFDATQGIQLKDWEALYAVHTLGGSPDQVSYQIVSYTTGTITAPSNWILVAVLNNDDQTIKLGTGVSIPKSGTYAASYGSGVPKGAILMWSGTTAPTGWSLCDGTNGTPDLRGRFVLGSGTGSGLTARTVGGTGGEEKHTLTTAELPAHNHAVSDPGHSHYWSATRQLAGTDDNNNTSELSKGDRSTQDVPTFYTNSTTTGISISNTGSGSSHENMPPFYVLAFIMKL
jgi:microcystin-dependent protein